MPIRKKMWIVAADASRARVFLARGVRSAFELVTTLEHAASRAKVHDLVSDDRGRKPAGSSPGRQNGRSYGRAGAEPDTDPKEVEAMRFARELARYLDRGNEEHAFDELILLAPPHFLGLVKENIGDRTRRLIRLTVDKDYSQLDPPALAEHIREIVSPQ
jgi:protein required for attachment to host cells